MRELDITGVLAIGNGEPCPFCTNNHFIMQEGKDFIKHCVENHPSELNNALFGSKPKPKHWLEPKFITLIAHIAAKIRMVEKADRISDEEYELQMEQIYHLINEYCNEVMINEGD